jgi:hypothetical protein
LSEAEFLAAEAKAAQGALEATLKQIKADLKTAADVRLWAECHPWFTVGAAGASGLAAGAAVGSAMRARKYTNGVPPVYAAPASMTPPASGALASVGRRLLDSAVDVLRTTAIALVSGALQGPRDSPGRFDGEATAEQARQTPVGSAAS